MGGDGSFPHKPGNEQLKAAAFIFPSWLCISNLRFACLIKNRTAPSCKMERIYLDHQVTTPALPEVVDSMMPYWSEDYASPSGLHAGAKQVRNAVELARSRVSSLLGRPDEGENVFFAGSGAEAVNLAVVGFARANRRFGNHIVCSAIEHPAVLDSLSALEREGFCKSVAPVDSEGFLSAEAVSDFFTEETILVCCQWANLAVGTVQSLQRISEFARERGIAFFVDASAAAGRAEESIDSIGADMVAISPHRFGGPKGVGCLFKRRRTVVEPLIFGGDQEKGLRAGTENVPAIVGAGVAADLARRNLRENCLRLGRLQKRLLAGVLNGISGVRLNGPEIGTGRLCYQLSFTLAGVEAEGLALFADMRGLAISQGSGCLSRALEPHYVFSALGMSPSQGKQTISLGIGLETTESEVDAAVEILKAGAKRLRSTLPGSLPSCG